ncbi:hypothetical protein EMIT0232MI5_60039 [Pseudomonas sp. IT-232MI5]
MQRGLHGFTEFFVFAGDDGGGQRVLGNLARQVRPGQHADARLRGDLFENLAHQFESLRFDAFGQADQHLAAQPLGVSGEHRAQCAGWQRDKTQIAGVEGCLQVGDGGHPRQNLDAFEVTRVFAIDPDGLGLLGVTHPLPDLMAVLGQKVGHGGTKTSASQDRNRALFSHMQSVNPYQWRCRHYTGQPTRGQPLHQLPTLVGRRPTKPRKMPAT